jgi:hypothetical protein
MPTRSYDVLRVRIVHSNGVFHVGCVRGSEPLKTYIRCASLHDANTHSLVASAIVWAFRRFNPYLHVAVS